MKTKQGLLNAVNEEIRHLQNLAERIETSDEMDLRPLSELAVVLATRRKALKLNPADVSELCGVSPNTYRAIESGKGNPTIKTLEGIGSVLNFNVWIELK
ncbi:helix-turn-helix transcriptional regulator [Marinobacter sp.]|uniref:helix-turn-helix domain-containing protein n=1 Tax=Marinobacter sp. TaxID=50741 RepID=UPI0025BB735A|nr:helix-turn-helix transcriptional regulator [Marinobacter sp.]